MARTPKLGQDAQVGGLKCTDPGEHRRSLSRRKNASEAHFAEACTTTCTKSNSNKKRRKKESKAKRHWPGTAAKKDETRTVAPGF